MLETTIKIKYFSFLPFETMVIIENYSFITHMNVKKTQIRNPFDQILGLSLVKDL
jgi:hypothetical protein